MKSRTIFEIHTNSDRQRVLPVAIDIHSMVLHDNVHMIVQVGGRSLHVSDGKSRELRGDELIRVHQRGRRQVVDDPVVVVLPLDRLLEGVYVLVVERLLA
jgi:hypothetical protein